MTLHRYIADVTTLEYDAAKCTGCGRCIEVCPHAVFEMDGNKATLAAKDRCMECGACQRNCAFGAISVSAGVGCAAAVIGSAFRKSKNICC
jgi:NAD-dependent dihydropyrimidine dehydrogenase PreA subunit